MSPFWTRTICILVLSNLLRNNAQTIKTKFSCEGRITGYYADVETGCQVYHMCDGLGRQFSYSCPNATLFQQRMLICDHWYMVNCSKSEQDYSANLLIGQRDKPFVGDFLRTPRPDLLSHPTAAEYNVIYRSGKQFSGENLVGVESEPEDNNTVTDRPLYFLPSHWSTEFYKRVTTSRPAPTSKPSRTTIASNIQSPTPTQVPVNFQSNFKATTPQFPLSVEPTTEAPDKLGILPPLPYQKQNQTGDNTETANNEAPVVNFESKFKATTPVYPLRVEATSVDPGDAGVLPAKHDNEEQNPEEEKQNAEEERPPQLNLGFEPPPFDNNFSTRQRVDEQDLAPPSKFYQPPKFEPDYTVPDSDVENNNVHHQIDRWENLRKKFLIPDYDFPLDSASRPSYDSVLSSFQAET